MNQPFYASDFHGESMTYIGNERKQEHTYVPVGEGISGCSACLTAEGGLPIDCPEKPLPPGVEDAIYKGDVEFIRGRWYISADALRREDESHGIEDLIVKFLPEGL
jgi:hypothetical protein